MAKPKSAAQKAGKPADGTAVFWKRTSFELRGSLQGAPKDWWELQTHVTWAMRPVGALIPEYSTVNCIQFCLMGLGLGVRWG
jgi:hypothetical protein